VGLQEAKKFHDTFSRFEERDRRTDGQSDTTPWHKSSYAKRRAAKKILKLISSFLIVYFSIRLLLQLRHFDVDLLLIISWI